MTQDCTGMKMNLWRMKMKYRVTYSLVFDVEAENEEEALDKANAIADTSDAYIYIEEMVDP